MVLDMCKSAVKAWFLGGAKYWGDGTFHRNFGISFFVWVRCNLIGHQPEQQALSLAETRLKVKTASMKTICSQQGRVWTHDRQPGIYNSLQFSSSVSTDTQRKQTPDLVCVLLDWKKQTTNTSIWPIPTLKCGFTQHIFQPQKAYEKTLATIPQARFGVDDHSQGRSVWEPRFFRPTPNMKNLVNFLRKQTYWAVTIRGMIQVSGYPAEYHLEKSAEQRSVG